jgi:Tfp pilus assembly protein PilX
MRLLLRMDLTSRIRTHKIFCTVKSDHGFLLVAALALLSVLTLLGTTAALLTRTDTKISGNFKNNQAALQVAMGGAERARQALRIENSSSSDSGSFSDELNSSARKGANGVLNGYSSTTDDQSIASGSLNGISYSAYLTNDVADGTSNTTDVNGNVLLTSVATGPNSSKARVEIIVQVNTAASSSEAVVYSKGDITGNGSSLTITGADACGAGTGLGPIYTMDPATTTLNGSPTLSGTPPTPQHGTLNIDIQGIINSFKPSASATISADQNGAAYGSSTNYVTVYSDTDNPPNTQGLKLQNVTGYGILLVKGDLVLGGGFNWNGIIYATGSVTLNGGGGEGINVHGQIYAGTSTVTDITINGGNTLGYDSCAVKKALATQAFKVVSWKQDY